MITDTDVGTSIEEADTSRCGIRSGFRLGIGRRRAWSFWASMARFRSLLCFSEWRGRSSAASVGGCNGALRARQRPRCSGSPSPQNVAPDDGRARTLDGLHRGRIGRSSKPTDSWWMMERAGRLCTARRHGDCLRHNCAPHALAPLRCPSVSSWSVTAAASQAPDSCAACWAAVFGIPPRTLRATWRRASCVMVIRCGVSLSSLFHFCIGARMFRREARE